MRALTIEPWHTVAALSGSTEATRPDLGAEETDFASPWRAYAIGRVNESGKARLALAAKVFSCRIDKLLTSNN